MTFPAGRVLQPQMFPLCINHIIDMFDHLFLSSTPISVVNYEFTISVRKMSNTEFKKCYIFSVVAIHMIYIHFIHVSRCEDGTKEILV